MEGGDLPEEWLISRICEEFGCLPSQAVEELYEGPTQLVLDIIEIRAYAQAKRTVEQVYEAAKARAEKGQDMGGLDLPASPMVQRVVEIQQEIERMQAEGELERG